MAWTRIVGGLVVLFAATYLIQFLFPRGTQKTARRLKQDQFAPMIAFFGIVLLALSWLEAIRREALVAWALGDGVGVIAALGLGIVLANRGAAAPPPRESTLRATVRVLRTYGTLILGAALAIYLAVRVFGATVEVFIAGAFGVIILASAATLFMRARKLKMRDE